eukprot:2343882-Rhodomonas_salina.1
MALLPPCAPSFLSLSLAPPDPRGQYCHAHSKLHTHTSVRRKVAAYAGSGRKTGSIIHWASMKSSIRYGSSIRYVKVAAYATPVPDMAEQ